MSQTPDVILRQYELGAIRETKKIAIGLINETWKISAERGDFILQRIHPIFGSDIMADIDAVTAHLQAKGWEVQRVVRTRDAQLFVFDDEQGRFWRVLTFIPGEVFETSPTTDIVREAGRLLGKFHRDASDLVYQFRHHRELHYNTAALFEAYKRVVHGRVGELPAEARELVAAIDRIPEFFFPAGLRTAVTQGDPKITNIIFRDARAVTLIDLDDCGNFSSPLYEIGDALRSWCGAREGDARSALDLEKFRAAIEGYRAGSSEFLTAQELALVPQALVLITLTLASRFLRDVIEDSYFGWDPAKYPTRKAHNLARARSQVALAEDVIAKRAELETMLRG